MRHIVSENFDANDRLEFVVANLLDDTGSDEAIAPQISVGSKPLPNPYAKFNSLFIVGNGLHVLTAM